ncbi:MAG: hypothetical protein ABWY54_05990 [Glaciihabitans sp.]
MSGARAEKLDPRAQRRAVSETGMRDTDPVATAASRPLTVIASGLAILVAIALTATHPGEIERPELMAAAFVFLGAACLVLVRGTDEMRGLFTGKMHALVVLLSWAAALLSALAQWSNNEFLRDDWGPYAVALTLIATSPYRPLGRLVLSLAASALFVGALGVLQSSLMQTTLPPTTFAVLAAAPVVLLASAGIVYARVGVDEHVRTDRHHTERPPTDESVMLTERERRVMLLAGEVAPLFSGVVQHGRVSDDDVARAGEISAAVRATMVHAANRSWLACATAEAVESARLLSSRPSRAAVRNVAHMLASGRVRDASDLSARMSVDQRIAIRALLEAFFVPDQVRPESFAVRVLRHGDDALLWIDVSFGHDGKGVRPTASPRPRQLRKQLAPYLAIARASFSAVDFITYSTEHSLKVTLRFSYGL